MSVSLSARMAVCTSCEVWNYTLLVLFLAFLSFSSCRYCPLFNILLTHNSCLILHIISNVKLWETPIFMKCFLFSCPFTFVLQVQASSDGCVILFCATEEINLCHDSREHGHFWGHMKIHIALATGLYLFYYMIGLTPESIYFCY